MILHHNETRSESPLNQHLVFMLILSASQSCSGTLVVKRTLDQIIFVALCRTTLRGFSGYFQAFASGTENPSTLEACHCCSYCQV